MENSRHSSIPCELYLWPWTECRISALHKTVIFFPKVLVSFKIKQAMNFAAFIVPPSHHPHNFPHSSVGKESACNAGDPGSIPGWGKSAGEGIGYSLQYSWASLVAQLVKNPPAMWETWVWSTGWEDPLEKEKATHSSMLAWRIPWIV